MHHSGDESTDFNPQSLSRSIGGPPVPADSRGQEQSHGSEQPGWGHWTGVSSVQAPLWLDEDEESMLLFYYNLLNWILY